MDIQQELRTLIAALNLRSRNAGRDQDLLDIKMLGFEP
jgi:hypothetical protein